jgi:hypothetical protein
MAEELGIISLETNLADIERPPEIPVGRYVGEIQSIETKTSGQGNEYFAMRILIPSENIPAEVQNTTKMERFSSITDCSCQREMIGVLCGTCVSSWRSSVWTPTRRKSIRTSG